LTPKRRRGLGRARPAGPAAAMRAPAPPLRANGCSGVQVAAAVAGRGASTGAGPAAGDAHRRGIAAVGGALGAAMASGQLRVDGGPLVRLPPEEGFASLASTASRRAAEGLQALPAATLTLRPRPCSRRPFRYEENGSGGRGISEGPEPLTRLPAGVARRDLSPPGKAAPAMTSPGWRADEYSLPWRGLRVRAANSAQLTEASRVRFGFRNEDRRGGPDRSG
jgi:hypothetical protein